MLTVTVALLLAVGFACASGCGSRTVFIPEESPIRMGPDSRVRVYTMQDGKWMLSDNRVLIPEGWYLVPPSFVREEE